MLAWRRERSQPQLPSEYPISTLCVTCSFFSFCSRHSTAAGGNMQVEPGHDAALEARDDVEQQAESDHDAEEEEYEEESDEDLDQDEEEWGAEPLQIQLEQQVLCRLSRFCQSIGAAFSVGGSLGRLQVALAVSSAPGRGGKRTWGSLVPLSFGGEEQDAEGLAQVLRDGCSEGTSEGEQAVLTIPAERFFTQFDLGEHRQVLGTCLQLLSPRAPGGLAAKLMALRAYLPAEQPASSQQGIGAQLLLLSNKLPPVHSTSTGTLLVCLPAAHVGGGLQVVKRGGSKGDKGRKGSRQSMAYRLGAGAEGGEVQWAAFLSGCSAKVLPPASGACVMLVYDLLASPSAAPLATSAVASSVATLSQELLAALNCPGFMASGGRIGYPCQQRYPQSLAEGITEEAARGMLTGGDAVVAQALSALGVPWKLQRAWNVDLDEKYFCGEGVWSDFCDEGVALGKVLPGAFRECHAYRCDDNLSFVMTHMDAKLDISVSWLGGGSAFGRAGWIMGASGPWLGDFRYSVDGYLECTLVVVADVPPFHQRQHLGSMGWAGKGS